LTVLATEDSTDDLIALSNDDAEAGVAVEEGLNSLATVTGSQADAIALLPEGMDRVVIVGVHVGDRQWRCHISTRNG